MTLMVRQMPPPSPGLPMQLSFFTNTVEWVAYERIQSDVFDHVLAVIPEFGLRVFQNPAGSDLGRLGGSSSSASSAPADGDAAPQAAGASSSDSGWPGASDSAPHD